MEKKKILLMIPRGGYYVLSYTQLKITQPALGLGYISSYLRSKGYDVSIVDANLRGLSGNKLQSLLIELQPQIVGVSFTTMGRFAAFELIRLVKKTLPNTITIAGGPHVSLTADDTLTSINELDIIVRGEGEETTKELIDALGNGNDLSKIAGISYRKDNNIIHNPPRTFIKDLDSLPFPEQKLDEYNFQRHVPGKGVIKFGSILASRGCPYNCYFCSLKTLWSRRVRYRSPENVIDELLYLKDKYNIRGFHILDDTFTLNRKWVEDICDLLEKRELNLSFICHIRVDSVDFNLLKRMKEVGCYELSYGVESGSPRILDEVIGKKTKIEQIRNVRTWCMDLGIHPLESFIVSHPTETKEDLDETWKLILESPCKDGVTINFLRIYPGTEVEKIAREKEILPHEFSWAKRFNQKIDIPSLHGDVPLFKDILSWKDISEFLIKWHKYKKFPVVKRISQASKEIHSVTDFLRLLKAGLIFLLQSVRGVLTKT